MESVLEGALSSSERQAVLFINIADMQAKLMSTGKEGEQSNDVIKDTVKKAYLWLASNYQLGDYLSIIGGAQGAYIARVLAAMLKVVDIQPFASPDHAERAWTAYMENTGTHEDLGRARKNSTSFRVTQLRPIAVNVHFLGLWDTSRLPFSTDLHPLIRCLEISTYIRHAVALHEKNRRIDPYLFVTSRKDKKALEDLTERSIVYKLEVWFVGNHRDIIGGLYSGSQSQPGNIPLRYMLRIAAYVGIFFDLQSIFRLSAVTRCPRLGMGSPSWRAEAINIDYRSEAHVQDALVAKILTEVCEVNAGYDLPCRLPVTEWRVEDASCHLCNPCRRFKDRIVDRFLSVRKLHAYQGIHRAFQDQRIDDLLDTILHYMKYSAFTRYKDLRVVA